MDEWRLYGDEGKRNGALSPPSQRLEQWLSLCVFYQGHERRTISLSAINSTVSFEADYPSVEAKGNKGPGDNRQHWGAEVPLLPGGKAPVRYCHNSKITILKKKKKKSHLPAGPLIGGNILHLPHWKEWPIQAPSVLATLPGYTSGGLCASVRSRQRLLCSAVDILTWQHCCEKLGCGYSEKLKWLEHRI